MYMQEVTVNNEVGLHARPATFLSRRPTNSRAASGSKKEDRRVNAKSLLGVLSLGIVQGTAINLIADGSDEKEAVEALSELVSPILPSNSGEKKKAAVSMDAAALLLLLNKTLLCAEGV